MSFEEPQTFRERTADWTVGVDALPLIHLQASLDADQEIYNINAHVSTAEIKAKKKGDEKSLGLSWKRSNISQNKTLISVGSKDPHNQFRKPMKEVFQDIEDTLQVEQAVIENCGIVHQNKYMNHITCLAGIQEIYAHHQRFSNKSTILARTLNFNISNPRRLVAAALYNHGVITSLQDKKIKRLRSILATDYYTFDDQSKGYDILFLEMENFLKALKGPKYWKYIATPDPKRYFSGTSKSVADAIRIYKLDNRKEVFAF
jgi:hypothetical protein